MPSLERDGFPGCCAGMVIFSFDAEYDIQHHEDTREDQSKDTLKSQIEYQIQKCKSSYTFMMASTNSNQIMPAEVLNELGFIPIQKANSTHEGIVITLWFKKLDLLEIPT